MKQNKETGNPRATSGEIENKLQNPDSTNMPYKILQESVTRGIYYATLANSFKTKYLCEKCNCTFTRKCYLILHMRYHAFKCKYCYKSFMHKSLLRNHESKMHEVIPHKDLKKTDFSCEKCAINFETKYYYKMHLWNFHKNTSKYICPKLFCQEELRTRKEFIEHQNNHDLRPCNFCGKKVKCLHAHLMIHSGRRYTCKLCQKNYHQYSSLRRHMLIHLKLKPYSCSVCEKSFNQRGNMITHFRTHSGERPHRCKTCHKTFVRSNVLKHHELAVHGGKEARSFKCNECKFTSTSQWRLNHHKKSIHSEIFKCEICSAILKCRSNLERHLSTHSKKKPFPCHYCVMEYATKAALTKHQKRCHSQG